VEWRKRVVFPAKLAPSQVNRFDLSLVKQGSKPLPPAAPASDLLHVRAGENEVVFSQRTGRLVSLRHAGVEYISGAGAGLEVVKDVPDSWIGTHTKLGEADGQFLAMPLEKAAAFAGVTGPAGDGRLEAVRIIEDGPVRTVVEVLCEWGESRAQIIYRIPKGSREIEVEVRVCWNEKDRTLKWSLGLPAPVAEYQGQTMFGSHSLPADGTECAFQQWCSAFDLAGSGMAVLNEGIYAGDCSGNIMRITLLRSPAYSAHAWEERAYMPKDRFVARMDQGERVFRFCLLPGKKAELITEVDRRALELNERPYAFQAFPAGTKHKVLPSIELSCSSVVLCSLRKEYESIETWIFRLFNPLGHAVVTDIRWMGRDVGQVKLEPYSIGLWRADGKNLQPIPDMGEV
jgi:alpha-mannosidase